MADMSFQVSIRSKSEEEARAYFDELRSMGLTIETVHRQLPAQGEFEVEQVWFVAVESETSATPIDQLTDVTRKIVQLHETYPIVVPDE